MQLLRITTVHYYTITANYSSITTNYYETITTNKNIWWLYSYVLLFINTTYYLPKQHLATEVHMTPFSPTLSHPPKPQGWAVGGLSGGTNHAARLLLLIMPHSYPGKRIYSARFSVSAPL
jgi:hypothetical protein